MVSGASGWDWGRTEQGGSVLKFGNHGTPSCTFRKGPKTLYGLL